MSIPRDHHYVPAFYLRRWCGGGGRLIEYRMPRPAKLITKTVSEEATGFERDLYRLPASLPKIEQLIETDFFRPVDTKAERVLTVMQSGGVQTLSNDQRVSWTIFLLSLLTRLPEDIKDLKGWVASEWNRDTKLSKRTKEELEIIALRTLMRICRNRQSIAAIVDLNWQIADFERCPPILTSDRPLVMTNGIEKKNSYIVLPISPTQMFTATATMISNEHIRFSVQKVWFQMLIIRL